MDRTSLLPILLVLVTGCNSKEGDGPLAVVNGEPIRSDEFYAYIERKPTVTVVGRDGRQTASLPVAGSLGFQALNDLISRRLLVKLAQERGVYPTKSEIEAEIALQKRSDANFVRRLSDQGITTAEIEEDVALDLVQERLVTQGVTVSEGDVEAFIKSHPEDFSVPATASLLWIVVPDAVAQKRVDNELNSGANFRIVAQKHSIAPMAKENGGAFPERQLSRLPANVRALVQKTPELQTTPWFKDGARWVKMFVEQKMASKPLPVDDVMRTKVRRAMAMQQGRQKNDLAAMLRSQLDQAEVKISRPELQSQWERAKSNLRPSSGPGADKSPN